MTLVLVKVITVCCDVDQSTLIGKTLPSNLAYVPTQVSFIIIYQKILPDVTPTPSCVFWYQPLNCQNWIVHLSTHAVSAH